MPGRGGQPLDRHGLRELGPQYRNRARHALHMALRPAETADRRSVLSGQQPVMHLAHELGLQHRHRSRPIEQTHQSQRRVRDLAVGRIDADRRGVGDAFGAHLDGEFAR